MRAVRGWLLGIAVFQALSTLVGTVQLLVVPEWYAEALDPTAFAGQYVLAAVLLGLVGAFQIAAIVVHLRRPHWLAAAYATRAW